MNLKKKLYFNHQERELLRFTFPTVFFLFFCIANVFAQVSEMSNPSANSATQNLYKLIQKLPDHGIAFGHQDATVYGVNWKDEDRLLKSFWLKSDVKKVAGQLPAVMGFDLGHLELGNPNNLDTVSFALIKNHIQRAHKKGAIITVSWHPNNPVSGGSSWDKTSAVSEILKGGTKREQYKLWINQLSDFFKSLTNKNGKLIPVVFRPYHEMNGNWFWWGKGNCSTEDYIQLWKETHQMLSENEVNNLLYAYSPNTFKNLEEFDTFYPGDEWVDIIGVDIYNHSGDEQFISDVRDNLQILKRISKDRNKPFILAESGNIKRDNITDWWTEVLYEAIKDSGISWLLVWRNANTDHFFASFKEDIAADNFKKFTDLEDILLLKNIKKINLHSKL